LRGSFQQRLCLLEVSEAVDQYGIEVSNVNGIIRRGLHTGVDHPKRFRMFRFMFDGLIETSKASSGLPCIGVLHERRERPLLRVLRGLRKKPVHGWIAAGIPALIGGLEMSAIRTCGSIEVTKLIMNQGVGSWTER
jgi:hypothetical protein